MLTCTHVGGGGRAAAVETGVTIIFCVNFLAMPETERQNIILHVPHPPSVVILNLASPGSVHIIQNQLKIAISFTCLPTSNVDLKMR